MHPRTSHLAPRTSHPAPRISHPAPRTSHLAPRTSHLAPRTPHPASRTPHLTPRTSHLAPRTPHPASRTPHPAPPPRTPHLAPRTPHLDDLRTPQPRTPHLLYGIAVDDLRPELGCYGTPLIHTPNIDRLAARSWLFQRHFVTVPTCGASRHSLLTGMLPRTNADLNNQASARQLANQPEQEAPETFVHHLRRNGYYTVGIGKLTHHPDGRVYGYTDSISDIMELPHSWDEMLFDHGKWGTGHNAFFGYADGSNRQSRDSQVKPYEAAEVQDEGYPDGLTANLALKKMNELAQKDQPFFLGVGFFKPHLPFTAPQKYWDLYQREDMPLSPSPDIPLNVHEASLQKMGEFNRYQLGEEKASLDSSLSDAYARKLMHAYYACVSYTDAQIGKLLDELDRLDLMENTIIVLWGDHGWQLGDYRMWGKHTLFERSVHSPLIIKPPQSNLRPRQIHEIVGSVDLYPTLMDLCGLPMPHQTDGQSLTGCADPTFAKLWRNTAYSYFRKGISLRTNRYRLTKFYREEEPNIELFDHQQDPWETRNIAGDHPELVEKLMPLLQEGNRGLFE